MNRCTEKKPCYSETKTKPKKAGRWYRKSGQRKEKRSQQSIRIAKKCVWNSHHGTTERISKWLKVTEKYSINVTGSAREDSVMQKVNCSYYSFFSNFFWFFLLLSACMVFRYSHKVEPLSISVCLLFIHGFQRFFREISFHYGFSMWFNFNGCPKYTFVLFISKWECAKKT